MSKPTPFQKGYWSSITREERHFTLFLFHDIQRDSERFCNLLRKKLGFPEDVTIVDVGYEVCFFRDLAKEECIARIEEARRKSFEKLTFDLVITLSNNSLVIIEAKVQQGFTMKQLNNIKLAITEIKKIATAEEWNLNEIYLVGLFPRPNLITHVRPRLRNSRLYFSGRICANVMIKTEAFMIVQTSYMEIDNWK